MSRLLEHPSSLSLRLMRTNARSYKILRSFTYPGDKGLRPAHGNQCKMKELGFWQMTRWKFHLLLLCVSWFLESVLTVCDQNWNQNILISSSVIFATLSCQGIKYEPVLKKNLTTLPCFMTFQPSEVKKMSTRGKVMGEEEDMLLRTFKGKPPKCHNCGVVGHTEK